MHFTYDIFSTHFESSYASLPQVLTPWDSETRGNSESISAQLDFNG